MHESALHFLAQAQSLTLTPTEKAEVRMVLEQTLMAKMLFAGMHLPEQQLTLTNNEKSDMRVTLQRAMRTSQAAEAAEKGFGFSFAVFRLPAMAFAVVMLVAAGGSGIAFAAEQALPGDFLYNFKINVNEAVVESFQLTPVARAEWAVRRLERRLAEAEQRAAQDLNAEQEDELATIIGHYAQRAHESVQSVPSAENTSSLQSVVQMTLDASERRLVRQAEQHPSQRLLRAVHDLRLREEQESRTEETEFDTVDDGTDPEDVIPAVMDRLEERLKAFSSSRASTTSQASSDASFQTTSSQSPSTIPLPGQGGQDAASSIKNAILDELDLPASVPDTGNALVSPTMEDIDW